MSPSTRRRSGGPAIVAVENEPQDLGRIESGERLLKEFPPSRVDPDHDEEPIQ